MMDHATIKRIAKEQGCRIDDLIALSRNNDPHYMGGETDWRDARWFAGLWERFNFRPVRPGGFLAGQVGT